MAKLDALDHVPLTWARAPHDAGFLNVGDALSPVIAAALSGCPIKPVASRSPHRRIAAIGTIAHALRGGPVHLWGTGLDRTIAPDGGSDGWSPPSRTRFTVHATRGPFTEAALATHGIAVPRRYGDPGYLVPRLWPTANADKRWPLGVVLHLSELATRGGAPSVKPAYRRYTVPPEWQGRVRLISMDAPADLGGIGNKIREIAACERILSTSLHGLVIADAYDIPSAWFGFHASGAHSISLFDPEALIDHRMRDLYAGLGLAHVPVFSTPRHQTTDWGGAIDALDSLAPSGFDPSALVAAFPGPKADYATAQVWPIPQVQLEGIAL
ncbi:MAG: polysaccharide pyruvyl transferase family protein [Pseudomonadota bacterium]